jgi:hypothetical protein
MIGTYSSSVIVSSCRAIDLFISVTDSESWDSLVLDNLNRPGCCTIGSQMEVSNSCVKVERREQMMNDSNLFNCPFTSVTSGPQLPL